MAANKPSKPVIGSTGDFVLMILIRKKARHYYGRRIASPRKPLGPVQSEGADLNQYPIAAR
jgi:hypothetical protein